MNYSDIEERSGYHFKSGHIYVYASHTLLHQKVRIAYPTVSHDLSV